MQGKYPHIEWLDLYNNGVVTECAILKKDPEGNVYFFPVNTLDMIDKKRLLDIVTNRNAHLYELWDLMHQITMRNGVNALVYFNQLAKVLTPSGAIIEVDPSRRGLGKSNDQMIDDTPTQDVRRGRATAPSA